ncbi:MAG: alpha-E domain-containing protein, partial [Planctomycetaceae bacterium]|nr:alpha-E domain-containing protein [Planctomycetaceae bacterium]
MVRVCGESPFQKDGYTMLSRVAHLIYWMARYVERAENLARFIDVTLQTILDQPENTAGQWEPLVRATGDEEWFEQHYDSFSSENVRQFLTFDRDYHSSIRTSLSVARENARTVREVISSEVWEQLNAYYHFVRDAAERGVSATSAEFYDSVKQHSHLFNGTVDATMTHGTGWHFANIGRLLERADKTSRILDVKYFTLLRTVQDVDTTSDDLLWSAVLRSVSGFEMFRKRFHALTIHRIVDFLIL